MQAASTGTITRAGSCSRCWMRSSETGLSGSSSRGCRFTGRLRQMRASIADYETLVGDVHDLRAFAFASDLRSLTATAKLMGESKATTSRRITRLETALGTALLRRSPRAVQ